MTYESLSEIASKPLDTRLLFLLKVDRKEHLEQLAQGKLRFRKLKFYTDAENIGAAHYDPDEGIDSILQGSQIKFGIKLPNGNAHEFSSESGLVDVRIHSNFEAMVLCLHAIHTDEWTRREFTEEQISEVKAYLRVPDSMRNYGDHIWLITNLSKFNERLVKAVKQLEVGVKSRFVRYVDFDSVHGTIPDERKAFVKHVRHRNDREFRYQILTQRLLVDPFILDIGDLRDISEIMPFEEFREMFSRTFQVTKISEIV